MHWNWGNNQMDYSKYFTQTNFQGFNRVITLTAGICFIALGTSLIFLAKQPDHTQIGMEGVGIGLLFLSVSLIARYSKWVHSYLRIITFLFLFLAISWGFWVGYRTYSPQSTLMGLMVGVFVVSLIIDNPNMIILFGLLMVGAINLIFTMTGHQYDELILVTLYITIVVAIGYVITNARMSLLNKLAFNKELLERIFNESSDALFLLDPEHLTILKCNNMARQMLDSPQMEIKEGTSFNSIFPTIDIQHIYKKVILGNAVLKREMFYHDSEGNDKWVYLFMKKIEFHDDILVLARLSDITELKKTSMDLASSKKELEHRNKELKDFTHITSHDLQEPLRMVGSFVQLLQKRYEDNLDEKGREYIQQAVTGVKRMQSLIRDLLMLSRLQRSDIIRLDVDLEELLAEIMENLQPELDNTGAVVTYQEAPVVKGNPTQLTQLFQNLIRNAIKFQPQGQQPEINISFKQTDKGLEICIEDNGIGIDPVYHEKIFDVFKRLHTQSEYPGTGIGLAICRKIVEQHGGKIWVESEPGKGSKFWFTLKD